MGNMPNPEEKNDDRKEDKRKKLIFPLFPQVRNEIFPMESDGVKNDHKNDQADNRDNDPASNLEHLQKYNHAHHGKRTRLRFRPRRAAYSS